MGAFDAGYNGPSITFTSLNSSTAGIGANEQGTLLVVGTAPQGSKDPKTFFSLADAQAEYGNFLQAQASVAGQIGYTLEPALELAYAQSGKFNSLKTVCVRAGASLANVSIADTANPVGTAYALTAKPGYAGSNTVTAVLSTSTYNLAIGANVQTLSLYDAPVGTNTVQETYTGTPQSIIQQLGQSSNLATVAGDNKIGVAGTYTLAGAQNGVNASTTDLINALNSAIGQDVDFVCVLSGDSGVQAALLSFCNTQAGLNKPCEAFMAPGYTSISATVAMNAGISSAGQVASKYVTYLANVGGVRRNPVTNQDMVYDGFYWACAIAAIKALNNPADPFTNKPINSLKGLTEVFTPSQCVNMGRYGVCSIIQDQSGIHIFDGVTTTDPGNYRRENVVAQEIRLIKYIRDATLPLIGTSSPGSNRTLIQQRVTDALTAAVRDNIILSFNPQAISVIPNPNQIGRYTVAIAYSPRVEIIELDFQLAIQFVL